MDKFGKRADCHQNETRRKLKNNTSKNQKPLSYLKGFLSELGGIRTPNLLGRNQVHYPVVLRVRSASALIAVKKGLQK